MRYWPWILSIIFASGCHSETGDLQPFQFDCGNPLIDAKTGALVMPKHTIGIQQQLPNGVASKDGCWTFTAEGRIEGYFQKETTDALYVFELRDDRWTLVDTQAGAVVRNPYALHDKVR